MQYMMTTNLSTLAQKKSYRHGLELKKATIEQYMTKSYQALASSKRIALLVGIEEEYDF